MFTKVGREKANVEDETAKANMEQQKCERIAKEVTAQKAECARQLAEAEPAGML